MRGQLLTKCAVRFEKIYSCDFCMKHTYEYIYFQIEEHKIITIITSKARQKASTTRM